MSHDVIIMAAGEGVRMRSGVPKVLHPVAGRPILSWIIDAVSATEPNRIMVVVGAGARRVKAILPSGVLTCHQPQRRGTGQAAWLGWEALGRSENHSPVMVLPGDTPLITTASLNAALDTHRQEDAAATVLTTMVDDASGYGRVLRDGDGRLAGVVEHLDATATQRQIKEINTSLYVFSSKWLSSGLAQIGADNRQGEYYLPDVIELMLADGRRVVALPIPFQEALGVNNQAQLSDVAAVMRKRILHRHLLAGVWMEDPDRTYVDADVKLAEGVRLYGGVRLEGRVEVGEAATVGPDAFVRDSRIGTGSRVWYSVVRESQIGPHVQVGPYASLRPGTRIDQGAKAGSFVEIKNSRLGEGAKAPHLSYVGDADVGEGANIGAGTITANYDGYRKHRTVIGPGAQIGSNTVLVAPVEVGEDGWTAAGSAITRPVPPGALAVERSSRKTILGYARKRAARYREEHQG